MFWEVQQISNNFYQTEVKPLAAVTAHIKLITTCDDSVSSRRTKMRSRCDDSSDFRLQESTSDQRRADEPPLIDPSRKVRMQSPVIITDSLMKSTTAGGHWRTEERWSEIQWRWCSFITWQTLVIGNRTFACKVLLQVFTHINYLYPTEKLFQRLPPPLQQNGTSPLDLFSWQLHLKWNKLQKICVFMSNFSFY